MLANILRNSQNMNLNDFIIKAMLCCIMRIDRSDDRNSEIVYSGIDKLVGLMRGKQSSSRFVLMAITASMPQVCVYLCEHLSHT